MSSLQVVPSLGLPLYSDLGSNAVHVEGLPWCSSGLEVTQKEGWNSFGVSSPHEDSSGHGPKFDHGSVGHERDAC